MIPKVYNMNSTMGEILADPKGKAILEQAMGALSGGMVPDTMAEDDGGGAIGKEMMEAMMDGMPLRQLLSFVPGIQKETLEKLIVALNS